MDRFEKKAREVYLEVFHSGHHELSYEPIQFALEEECQNKEKKMICEPVSQAVLDGMKKKTSYQADYEQIKEALETFPGVLIRDMDGRNPKAVCRSIHEYLGKGKISCHIQADGTLLIVRKEAK